MIYINRKKRLNCCFNPPVVKEILPVMATTRPSRRFRLSDPRVGPRIHSRKKWKSKAKTKMAVITEPMLIPMIAPVPRPMVSLTCFVCPQAVNALVFSRVFTSFFNVVTGN